ncbi:MAG: hypothetical protein V7K18_21750 [Nostoc sp.]|uniref:hypothetical protein n=1 Tax=Nostoc sp. TaxID=1180 RepID=UPI002FF4EF39
MSSANRFFNYDASERIYLSERKEVYEIYLDNLEKLIIQYLPKEAHIFDFCCSRGEVAQLLAKKDIK